MNTFVRSLVIAILLVGLTVGVATANHESRKPNTWPQSQPACSWRTETKRVCDKNSCWTMQRQINGCWARNVNVRHWYEQKQR